MSLSKRSIIFLMIGLVIGCFAGYSMSLIFQKSDVLEVIIVNDRDYYHTIKKDIENAKSTIFVSMYIMKYDPIDTEDWANDLIQELVKAKERGVSVRIIIEYLEFYNDPKTVNLEAEKYLSENGVDVRLDYDSSVTDHMKLVIIDDEIVYIGSHNWSEAGLYYNHETSVKIISKNIASIMNEFFESD